MLGTPRLSVIVATYKRPKTILRLMEILNSQVRFHLRDHLDVTVVDDGSPGGPLDFDTYLFPFNYIYRERDSRDLSRVYSARNLAASRGSGDIIVQIDDDVTFHERTLSEIQNMAAIWMGLAPKLDWLWSPRISNNTDKATNMGPDRDGFHRGPDGLWRDGKAQWMQVAWSSCDSSLMVCPRKTWDKIGGYDEQFDGCMGAADQELVLRVQKIGGVVMLGPYFANKEDEETGSLRDAMIARRKRETNEELMRRKHPDMDLWQNPDYWHEVFELTDGMEVKKRV